MRWSSSITHSQRATTSLASAPRRSGGWLDAAVAAHRRTPVSAGTLRSVTGRTYAENRPYLVPESLETLSGPLTGLVMLPGRLDWSERSAFHLDVPAERNLMYERVIREATRPGDLDEYLNGTVLREVWRSLFLPARVRRMWEERFPDLSLAA